MAFKLSNGEKYEVKGDYSDRKYLRVLAQRVKEDGMVKMSLPEEFKNSSDLRVEEVKNLVNRKTRETFTETFTYLLA